MAIATQTPLQSATVTQLLTRDADLGCQLDALPVGAWEYLDYVEATDILRERRELRAELERRHVAEIACQAARFDTEDREAGII